MIATIEFNGEEYPAFQSTGNAAKFIIPFAKEVCSVTDDFIYSLVERIYCVVSQYLVSHHQPIS